MRVFSKHIVLNHKACFIKIYGPAIVTDCITDLKLHVKTAFMFCTPKLLYNYIIEETLQI